MGEWEWKILVVSVHESCDGRGVLSLRADRAKKQLGLALDSCLVAGDPVYTVVTRAALEQKAGNNKDAKNLATVLRQMIKQDRVKGVARKQKEQREVADAKVVDCKKQDEDNETTYTCTSKEEPKSKTPEELSEEKIAREIDEELRPDNTLRSTLGSDQILSDARQVLSAQVEETRADRVYVLIGFPATAEEAALLTPNPSRDGVLDAVIELVGGGPHDEAWSVAQSRTESQQSQISVAKSTPGVSFDGMGSELAKSTASLPNLAFDGSVLPRSSKEGREAMRDAAGRPFLQGGVVDHDIVASMKLARATARGPGWRDVVFLEVPVTPRHEGDDPALYLPSQILHRFCTLVQATACERFRFSKYLATCKHIQIPKSGNVPPAELLDNYRKLVLESVPHEGMRSIAVVLDCMVGAVCGETVQDLGTSAESTDDSNGSLCTLLGVPFGDDIALRLAVFGDTLLRGATSASKRKTVTSAMRRATAAERRYAAGTAIPGGVGRQQMPRAPVVSHIDRGIEETQFRPFHGFSRERLRFLRTIEAFEAVLNRADPSRDGTSWDLSQRNLLREMSPEVAAQVIGNALAEEPERLSSYIAKDDTLVLALHRMIPSGRQAAITRSVFEHTSLRPAFSEWPFLDLRKGAAFFDVEPEPICQIEQVVRMLFPCDHSVIRIESLAGADKQDLSWCSVQKDGHRFGLRRFVDPFAKAARRKSVSASASDAASAAAATAGSAQVIVKPTDFFASFDDGALLTVRKGAAWPGKPDKYGTMLSLYTAADGLHVRHSSDGTIRMSSPQALGSRGEEERLLLGSGAVVCFFQDGSKKILFPDGNVTDLGADNRELARRSFRETDTGRTSAAVDPEAGAVVLSRDDGVVLVFYKAGSKVKGGAVCNSSTILVTHADGTRMLTEGNVVRVETDGMPSVKVFTDFESTAYNHSLGGRVDIARGGRGVRSSTLLPDATVVHIEYDTRVTAKVNGSLRILKPDGTAVDIADDSTVVWRPWNVDEQQREHRSAVETEEERKGLHPDAREEPDRKLACYIFNTSLASLYLRDWESNSFFIENVTSASQRKVTVHLSGEFDPVRAVINEKVVPRLFVLDGEGRAHELLSRKQIDQQRKQLERRYRSKFLPISVSAQRVHATPPIPEPKGKRDKSHSIVKRAPKQDSVSSEETYEAFCLPLCAPLPSLSLSESFIPSLPLQVQAVRSFETNAKGEVAGTASSVPLLLDRIIEVRRVDHRDRSELSAALLDYIHWKGSMAATDNRFNVDDLRDDAAKDEEVKLQSLIEKERRRQRKADQKRTKQLGEQLASSHEVNTSQSTPLLPLVQLDDLQDTTIRGDEDALIEPALSQSSDDEEPHDPRPVCPEPRNEALSPGLNYWQVMESL